MLIRDVITDRAPPEICENTITAMQGIAWFDQLTASRSQLLEEIEHIESFGNSASMVDLDRLKQLAADWPDSHSAHTIETTADYRISVLRAISASKFMRRASRCNY